jgi:hypothetical protein
VIVLKKKHRRRSKVRAVDRHDLRTSGELQHGFVGVAEHERRARKRARHFDRLWRPAKLAAAHRRQQVPVHVIPVGDDGVGMEGERTPQQTVASGGGKKRHRVVAAGAGKEQHAEARRTIVGRGKRGQLPSVAERAAVRAGE